MKLWSRVAAIILASDTCLCNTKETCKPNKEDKECELKKLIMVNDGMGINVSVTAFLMFDQMTNFIKSSFKQNMTVRIELTWALPWALLWANNKMRYQLWTTSKVVAP